MLSDKLNEIEKSISNISTSHGYKKIIAEHTSILNELQECEKYIDELDKKIENINNNNNISINLECSNYTGYITELQNLVTDFDDIYHIEKQIDTYTEALTKINAIAAHIDTLKMNTINL